MFSSKLSLPIDISHLDQYKDIDDYLYQSFKSNLMDQNNRSKLSGEFIYLDCTKWIDKKNEVFWHLISLDEKEKFNVLPCTNCPSIAKCPNNCISPTRNITLSNGQKRNICYYRAVRINWINEIITLLNNKDPYVKSWKKEIKGKGAKRVQIYIRFTHEAVDYLIILEEKRKSGKVKQYNFVTAFPVFYISSKKKYEKEYKSYLSIEKESIKK
jgi:hypothetical protein